MAANLATMSDGRVAMAAWGRVPVWHGTGQRSDQLMTVEEAARVAGFDYPVLTRQAMFEVDGEHREGVGVQIVRGDTWQPLGYASEWYRPIPNMDAFNVAGQFIGKGLAGVMTAGVLGKGEKAWCQFVLGEIGVNSIDRGIATLLVSNDHTASGACKFGFTTVWVVCANTEAAAQREMDRTKNCVAVIHGGDVNANLKTVENCLSLAERRFRDWETAAKELAAAKLQDSKEVWRLAIASMMPPETTIEAWREKPDKSRAYHRNLWAAIFREYQEQPGHDIESRQGTAWGALNGVTGWVDFNRAATKSAADRTKQMWFGSGAEIKQRAVDVAVGRWIEGKPWGENVLEVEKLAGIGA